MNIKIVYRIVQHDGKFRGQTLLEEQGQWENIAEIDRWHSTAIAAKSECFEHYNQLTKTITTGKIGFEYVLKAGVYDYSERVWVVAKRDTMQRLLTACNRIIQNSVCIADKPIYEVMKVDIDFLNRLVFEVAKAMDVDKPIEELTKMAEERVEVVPVAMEPLRDDTSNV